MGWGGYLCPRRRDARGPRGRWVVSHPSDRQQIGPGAQSIDSPRDAKQKVDRPSAVVQGQTSGFFSRNPRRHADFCRSEKAINLDWSYLSQNREDEKET
jgi:hypothetical protein